MFVFVFMCLCLFSCVCVCFLVFVFVLWCLCLFCGVFVLFGLYPIKDNFAGSAATHGVEAFLEIINLVMVSNNWREI